MITGEGLLVLRREAEEMRKNLETKVHLNEALWKDLVEKQRVFRSISENLAMIDEQKKHPSELVEQNIAEVIRKYDEEVTPRIDQINETKTNRINQSLDELNNILEIFNFIASYVVTGDTKIDKMESHL